MAQIDHGKEGIRQWVTGLIVVASVIVGVLGFAHLSRGWTLAISTAILIGLLVFFWRVGRDRGR